MDIKEQVKRILERLDQAELANYDDYVDQITDELYKKQIIRILKELPVGSFDSTPYRDELVKKLQAKAKK